MKGEYMLVSIMEEMDLISAFGLKRMPDEKDAELRDRLKKDLAAPESELNYKIKITHLVEQYKLGFSMDALGGEFRGEALKNGTCRVDLMNFKEDYERLLQSIKPSTEKQPLYSFHRSFKKDLN